ncbi:MAG: PIG-L deacetylase family protein, partial [Chthoniobacterales bacterium]
MHSITKNWSELKFQPHSRIMFFAPHPDDESLAAGVLLQNLIAVGAAVRVIYATDGDDNRWPQRAEERKWRLGALDRERWGRRRRREAIAALEALGLQAADARFLGLPDQGLTTRLLHDCSKITQRLGGMIREWTPTDLVMPSLSDTHPDHSALAVLIRVALRRWFLTGRRPVEWSYLVHGRRAAFARVAREFPQSDNAIKIKRRAIECHKSQLKLSRKRFLAYAKRTELFHPVVAGGPRDRTSTIRSITRTCDKLRLSLIIKPRPIPVAEAELYLVGCGDALAPLGVRLHLPTRNARVQLSNCATGRRIGVGIYRGNASH